MSDMHTKLSWCSYAAIGHNKSPCKSSHRKGERLRVTWFKHMFVMTLDSTMEYTGYIKAYKNHIIHLMTSAEFNLHISF